MQPQLIAWQLRDQPADTAQTSLGMRAITISVFSHTKISLPCLMQGKSGAERSQNLERGQTLMGSNRSIASRPASVYTDFKDIHQPRA